MSTPKLATSESGASSNGIGHYKGVMLCNRPFAGTLAPARSSGPEKPVFNCGVVAEPMGINVPISMKEKLLKRPKKDSVLVKHKKWLIELQKTKEKLEDQYVKEIQAKEEAKAKFEEHERKMREYTRNLLKNHEDKTASNISENTFQSSGTYSALPSLQADAKESNNNPVNQESAKRASSASASLRQSSIAPAKLTNRPAWAMTEKTFESKHEEKKQQEEDELLNFVDNLDYEKVIEDIEVKVMLEKLEKRVIELEKEVQQEEMNNNNNSSESRLARKEMIELMQRAQNNLVNSALNNLTSEQLQAIQEARALLGEDELNSNVHSTKSIAMLLKQAKDKISTVQEAAQQKAQAFNPMNTAIQPAVNNEPKVVIHDPNEGMRLEIKQDVNKLPYMHRNPAV